MLFCQAKTYTPQKIGSEIPSPKIFLRGQAPIKILGRGAGVQWTLFGPPYKTHGRIIAARQGGGLERSGKPKRAQANQKKGGVYRDSHDILRG